MARKEKRDRATRAGLMALLMGTLSIIFIGMEFFGVPVALLGALLARGYYGLSRDGKREEWGFVGFILALFVLFKELVVDRFLTSHFGRELFELNDQPITVAVVLMVGAMVASLVWVFRTGGE